MIEKEKIDKLKKRVNILEKKISRFYGDSNEEGLSKIPLTKNEFLQNTHVEASAFSKQPQDPFTLHTHVYNEMQKEEPKDIEAYKGMVIEKDGLVKLANQLVYDLFSIDGTENEEILSLQRRIFTLDIFKNPEEFIDYEYRNFMIAALHSKNKKTVKPPVKLISLHEWYEVLLVQAVKFCFDDVGKAFFERPATNKHLRQLFKCIKCNVITDRFLVNRLVKKDFEKKKKYTYWLRLLESFFKRRKYEYTGDIDIYLFNCNTLVEESSDFEWAVIYCPTASWTMSYHITDDNCLTIPLNDATFANLREYYVAGTSADSKYNLCKFGIGEYIYPVNIFDYRQY